MYNEAKVISSVVSGLREVFTHVLCVDDGSTDDSAIQARNAGANIVQHALNIGQGGAIATGFSIAGGTITNTTLTVIGDVTIGGVNSGDQLITLTGDVSGSGTGTFTTTTNSVGGVSSSTITTVSSNVLSATSSNTANTIVKRDPNGNFDFKKEIDILSLNTII